MKIRCKIRAYYNAHIIKPGDVIEYKGKNIPSWAEVVNEGVNEEKQTAQTQQNQNVDNLKNKTPEGVNVEVNDDLENKTPEELEKIADELMTEALDKNIMIETKDKTLVEIINELQGLIKKEK